MDPLTPEDVNHIAQLAYIKLSADESEKMRVQLTDILGHFQALSEMDTEGVEPTGHTTDSNTIMRDDEVHPPLDQEELDREPKWVGGDEAPKTAEETEPEGEENDDEPTGDSEEPQEPQADTTDDK